MEVKWPFSQRAVASWIELLWSVWLDVAERSVGW